MRTARSRATHVITFECTNCRRPPRTSHSPSSGSRHAVARNSIRAHCNSHICGRGRIPASRASDRESMTSPYTSSWSWFTASLPMRTGAEPAKPDSHGSSYSGSRRSPATPYMICRSAGLPATARSSQSRQASASSR